MPDPINSECMRNYHYYLSQDLHEAWDSWKLPDQEKFDQFEKCIEFIEVLLTEVTDLSISAMAENLPPGFRTSYSKEKKVTFGGAFRLLCKLKGSPFDDIKSSKPESRQDMVSIEGILNNVKSKLEELATPQEGAPEDVAPRTLEGWLRAVEIFVQFRNLIGHRAKMQQGDCKPTINVSDKLRALLSDDHYTKPLCKWAEWLAFSAVNVFINYRIGSYKTSDQNALTFNLVSSKGKEIRVARNLIIGQQEPVIGEHWYIQMLGDNPDGAFLRLSDDDKIRMAIAKCNPVISPIYKAASNGTLMAVIGPELGYPTDDSEIGAKEILHRIDKLSSDINYRQTGDFLHALAKQRLHLSEQPETNVFTLVRIDKPTELAGKLALIAKAATIHYAETLSSGSSPLSTKDVVKMEPIALSALCRDILRLAQEIKSAPADEVDLGAMAISMDLVDIRSEIALDKGISLSQVDWLTDLLWHTLRWDAPYYPDSESMAIQISLCARTETINPKVLRFHGAASSSSGLVIEPENCQEYITGWLSRLKRRVDTAKKNIQIKNDPHTMIARAMAVCLSARNSTTKRLGIGNSVFIVDASLDQRMADALEASGVPSAIVYPVTVSDKPAWAVRRFPEKDAECDLLADSGLGGTEKAVQGGTPPRVVVIKPFGAPGEDTNHKNLNSAVLKLFHDGMAFFDGMNAESLEIKHRILFDDISILHDLIKPVDSLPPGFRTLLHDEPSPSRKWELFFLGYPLDEPGRRTRLIADVHPNTQDPRNNPGKPLRTPVRHYLSEPAPTGLDSQYLFRAGFLDAFRQMPLSEALHGLGMCLNAPPSASEQTKAAL